MVFPAYAGMFLKTTLTMTVKTRFPRVCGDVPTESQFENFGFEFSPRMRGCSERGKKFLPDTVVFPAYAGMFLRV